MPSSSQKTAELNDQFRKASNPQAYGKIYQTAEINSLSPDDQLAIFTKVRLFDDFNTENDPYGEHDFGTVEHNGEKIFWKIDYYNQDMSAGSEDPADPEQTTRVMTIMLAHEY